LVRSSSQRERDPIFHEPVEASGGNRR
jgi:hypothetical protein